MAMQYGPEFLELGSAREVRLLEPAGHLNRSCPVMQELVWTSTRDEPLPVPVGAYQFQGEWPGYNAPTSACIGYNASHEFAGDYDWQVLKWAVPSSGNYTSTSVAAVAKSTHRVTSLDTVAFEPVFACLLLDIGDRNGSTQLLVSGVADTGTIMDRSQLSSAEDDCSMSNAWGFEVQISKRSS